jgi:hypothetical protein
MQSHYAANYTTLDQYKAAEQAKGQPIWFQQIQQAPGQAITDEPAIEATLILGHVHICSNHHSIEFFDASTSASTSTHVHGHISLTMILIYFNIDANLCVVITHNVYYLFVIFC